MFVREKECQVAMINVCPTGRVGWVWSGRGYWILILPRKVLRRVWPLCREACSCEDGLGSANTTSKELRGFCTFTGM